MDSITTLPTARMIYDLGEFLVLDDKDDTGKFSYRNRKYHTYHGKKSPNHPSPVHHWQLGGFMMLVGGIASLIEVAKEAQQDLQQQ